MVADRIVDRVDATSLAEELSSLRRPIDPVEAGEALQSVRQRLFGKRKRLRIGRYVVERPLGRGGEGVVLLARDPELDRWVALKKVREGGRTSAARARLAKEARALAQLSDPNVVRVFETVEQDDELLVAMEYVEGQTLRQWLEAPRAVAEIVDALIAAGRGLAAAHAAGIVHGDFKPDNVLVGDDGRVRVADLGLARIEAEAVATEELTSGSATSGTPGYQAPECAEGRPPSTAADQYSFCATLYEALFSTLPGAGRSAPVRAIPRSLVKATRRGLSSDPRNRFASMTALLAALQRRPRSGTTWAVLGVAVLASAASAVGLSRASACDGGRARAESVWTTAAQRAVATHYSAPVTQRIGAGVDAWLTDWVETHRAACLAGGDGLDRAMHCLDARLDELGGILRVIEDGAPDDRASRLVYALASPRSCRDARTAVPGDRDALARLQTAKALQLAGRFEESIEISREVEHEATQRGDDALLARALLRIASADHYLGRFESARQRSERALELATAADDADAAASAASSLVFVCGYNLGDAEAAARYARFAQSALERGDLGAESRAELLMALGADAYRRGDSPASRRYHEEALGLRRSVFPEAHPDVAVEMSNLAFALGETGEQERSLALHRRALEIREQTLGPDHPDVAESLHGLGGALRHSDPAAARDYFERALALRERTQGADHPEAAGLHINIANLALGLDDADGVASHLDRAESIIEGNPSVANLRYAVLAMRGQLHAERGEHEDAVAAYSRAIEAWGSPSSALAEVWRALAGEQRALDQPEAAAESEREAAVIEASLP